MEEQQRQTVEEALWGYKDQHGKWTPGLVQQFSAFQECSTRVLSDFKEDSNRDIKELKAATNTKLNATILLSILSLGRAAWPDALKLILQAAQAHGLHP
jgi:hypothetical protein